MKDINKIRLSSYIKRPKTVNTKTGIPMASLLLKVGKDSFKCVAYNDIANATLSTKDGFTWVLDNMSPALKKEAKEMAREVLGAEVGGDHFIDPEDKAAEAMGMTSEEAAPILRELKTDYLYPGWDGKPGLEQWCRRRMQPSDIRRTEIFKRIV